MTRILTTPELGSGELHFVDSSAGLQPSGGLKVTFITSVVPCPYLVAGSKSNLVHQDKRFNKLFLFRYRVVIHEVQSGGILCWSAQCVLLSRVLGEISLDSGQACPAPPTMATTLIITTNNYCTFKLLKSYQVSS